MLEKVLGALFAFPHPERGQMLLPLQRLAALNHGALRAVSSAQQASPRLGGGGDTVRLLAASAHLISKGITS